MWIAKGFRLLNKYLNKYCVIIETLVGFYYIVTNLQPIRSLDLIFLTVNLINESKIWWLKISV